MLKSGSEISASSLLSSGLPRPMLEAVDTMNRYGQARRPFLLIIDYEMAAPRIIPLDELEHYDIEVSIDGHAYTRRRKCVDPGNIELKAYPIEYERYLAGFEILHGHFVAGNTYLANLTYPTRIETNLSLEQLYGLSEARYRIRVGNEFTCYSPESFVVIRGREISSYPMKGTIDADLPDAEKLILADEKETAEHITIVDLIRNDIGMIAQRVEVPRFRYIDCIETPFKRLLQVSSEVRGYLEPQWNERIGTILARLLPAGSICGAPKRKTVEVIAQAEMGARGYYTGVFGVFDGRELSTGVMIRFVELTDDGMQYRSGGGLTIYADPRNEYQELIDKIYVPAFGNYSHGAREVSQPRPSRKPHAPVPSIALRD